MAKIASRYYITLRDTSYVPIARFDSFQSLSYSRTVNNTGTFSFSINAEDSRADLFETDGLIEIYRSIPGMGIPWYCDFRGFHRYDSVDVSENGSQIFVSSGPDLMDLLARTGINYVPATIKAYKDTVAETAIKEYVEENCGASATVANGRESDGVLPDFLVQPTTGTGNAWEGDRAFENLLDVIRDIATDSDMDFDMSWDASVGKFVFNTYADQLGLDRTTVGLNTLTGLNGAGVVPTVFSLQYGNIKRLKKTYDRLSESNVVSVLGEGDGATRLVVVRQSSAITDSPWNRREISRPKTGFISEMEQYGDEVLDENKLKDTIEFSPLLQERCMYGVHFFLGDRITVIWKGTPIHKRIVSIQNTISSTEDLQITFSDSVKL
jgi:hypothetical protein